MEISSLKIDENSRDFLVIIAQTFKIDIHFVRRMCQQFQILFSLKNLSAKYQHWGKSSFFNEYIDRIPDASTSA